MRKPVIWTLIFAGCALALTAIVLAGSHLSARAAVPLAAKVSAIAAWQHGKGGRYLQRVTWDIGADQIDARQLNTDAMLAFSNPPPGGAGPYKAAMLDAELAAQSIQVGASGQATVYLRKFSADMQLYRAAVSP